VKETSVGMSDLQKRLQAIALTCSQIANSAAAVAMEANKLILEIQAGRENLARTPNSIPSQQPSQQQESKPKNKPQNKPKPQKLKRKTEGFGDQRNI